MVWGNFFTTLGELLRKFSVTIFIKHVRILRNGSYNSASHLCNCFLASGELCHLLITFANSLYPDQDQHDISPELDCNSDGVPERFLKKKVCFEKKSADDNKTNTRFFLFVLFKEHIISKIDGEEINIEK